LEFARCRISYRGVDLRVAGGRSLIVIEREPISPSRQAAAMITRINNPTIATRKMNFIARHASTTTIKSKRTPMTA
jgi:hypothetical protein